MRSYSIFLCLLISLSIMSSRFIHVVRNDKFSFFLGLNNNPLYTYDTFSLSIDGHSNWFHILAIVNSTVVNMRMHVSPQDTGFIFFGCIPRNKIAGSYGICIFNFLRNFLIVFHSDCIVYCVLYFSHNTFHFYKLNLGHFLICSGFLYKFLFHTHIFRPVFYLFQYDTYGYFIFCL